MSNDIIKKIKVRFAPSPTGNLHIGGARTALFNWLFAKKNNGDFILRIDDTDLSRSTNDSIDSIIDDLKWLGITWDNDIVKASDRTSLYLDYAKDLLNKGLAYYDTSDKGTCIKIKLKKDQDIILFDDIKGKVVFPKDIIDDFVLVKSDGTPSYNFATVIDDHLMDITHVYRADEHLNNTPKQILIYNYFNWSVPKFGHMSLILGKDGKKMSKRDGSTTIKDFRNQGFLSSAVVNYISQLGWGHPQRKDVYSLDDLISLFTFKRVKSDSATFDYDKFLWINSQHLKMKTNNDLKDLLKINLDDNKTDDFINFFKKDWTTSLSFIKDLDLISKDTLNLTQDSLDLLIKNKNIIKDYSDFLTSHPGSYVNFDSLILDLKTKGISTQDVMWSLRSLIIGSCHGPAIQPLGALIKKDILLKRLGAIKLLL